MSLERLKIYDLDYGDDKPRYYLWKTITEENMKYLKIIHFPTIEITFDDVFEEVES